MSRQLVESRVKSTRDIRVTSEKCTCRYVKNIRVVLYHLSA